MCFLFSPLASVIVIVIPCLKLLKKRRKKKAREEKGSSNVFSRLAGNELRAARKRYAGHSLELRNDVGATLHGGDTGEGPWLPANPGLSSLDGSVDLWSSHTDGDWLVCPSHLQPHRPLTLISSVQNTRLHTADSSNSAEDIGRCAPMLCNTSDRDSS